MIKAQCANGCVKSYAAYTLTEDTEVTPPPAPAVEEESAPPS